MDIGGHVWSKCHCAPTRSLISSDKARSFSSSQMNDRVPAPIFSLKRPEQASEPLLLQCRTRGSRPRFGWGLSIGTDFVAPFSESSQSLFGAPALWIFVDTNLDADGSIDFFFRLYLERSRLRWLCQVILTHRAKISSLNGLFWIIPHINGIWREDCVQHGVSYWSHSVT
jgi:hypothetical protein